MESPKSCLSFVRENRKLLASLALSVSFFLFVGVLSSGHYQRSQSDRVVQHSSNRYVQAQRSTVNVKANGEQGSGMVVQRGSRLFVWTAAHVVEGNSQVKVRQVIRNSNHKSGELSFNAVVVWRDAAADVALLWLDAPVEYFSSVEFDSITPAQIGSAVYHVGNWLGQEVMDGSVSVGVVSQIGAQLEGWPWGVLDQANLLIVPGSSGGPIFNDKNDKVIGIAVGAIRSISGIAWYVPVRNLVDAASQADLLWAVYGDFAPSNKILLGLIAADKASLAPTGEVTPVKKSIKPLRSFRGM